MIIKITLRSTAVTELHRIILDLCSGSNVDSLFNSLLLHKPSSDSEEAGEDYLIVEKNTILRSLTVSQFEALSLLYTTTNGASWTHKNSWLSGSDPCASNWYGVTCNSTVITSLTLQGNNIQGSLPSQLGQLTEMSSSFHIFSNSFSGLLPSQLGQLTEMSSSFYIYSNRFSGLLPSQFKPF
jgi:hypothetical protein